MAVEVMYRCFSMEGPDSEKSSSAVISEETEHSEPFWVNVAVLTSLEQIDLKPPAADSRPQVDLSIENSDAW